MLIRLNYWQNYALFLVFAFYPQFGLCDQPYSNPEVISRYNAAPCYFVGSMGNHKTKTGEEDVVAFIQTQNGRVLFTASGAYIGIGVKQLHSNLQPSDSKKSLNENHVPLARTVVLKAGFSRAIGKKQHISPRLETTTNHVVSFFKGPMENWKTGLPTYKKLVYDQVWTGITLEYLAYMDHLEYRLIVSPNSDPQDIAMETGAGELKLDEVGNMLAYLDGGILKISHPVAYQELEGRWNRVPVTFMIKDHGRYGFMLGDYDTSRELIIDPELTWSSYLGGQGGAGNEYGEAIAIDSSGNAYITGYTPAGDFPATTGSYDEILNGGERDVFIVKLNASGSGLIYATFLGGGRSEEGLAIAVDASGNAYLTGYTQSYDFPYTAGVFDPFPPSGYYPDIFVCKINAAGTDLVYSTFLGGTYTEAGHSIVLDGSGQATVGGWTSSTNFPTTAGAFDTSSNGGGDGFITKFNADGSDLLFSTLLGGPKVDIIEGMTIDTAGNIYVGGYTSSPEFPVTSGAFQETFGGINDVFVCKFNSTASTMLYGTFIGGANYDYGMGIAIDSSGQAHVTGYTRSADFPTTPGSLDPTYHGSGYDAFVCKLNSSGSGLEYATFLDESSSAYGYSIAIDSTGNAVAVGQTGGDFPTTSGAFDETANGGDDVFVVKLNQAGSSLLFSTFLGGSSYDGPRCIVLDSSDNAYVTGYTYSKEFPMVAGSFDLSLGGSMDAFVTKINSTGSALAYSTFLGGSGGDDGMCIAMDDAGNTYVSGLTLSDGFPTTTGVFDLTYNNSQDVFVSKFSGDGSTLEYSTYVGGSHTDTPYGIAVDSTGSAYVAGTTQSNDFPTTSGAYDELHNGTRDVFVSKLNSTGTALTYSTYLGSSNGEECRGIAIDPLGNAYIVGFGTSIFPTTSGAFDETNNGGYDVFVSKLNQAGTALAFSTFLGGSNTDYGHGIAVDSIGNAYVTGSTQSSNFPVTSGSFDESANGSVDVFVTKIDDTGSSLVYSTYLGSPGGEQGHSIAVNPSGDAFITGYTDNSTFPITVGAYDDTINGGDDAFVLRLNSAGTALSYSTFLGGSTTDHGYAIAIDSMDYAYITGYTRSSNFPTTSGAQDETYNGEDDVFLAKISHLGDVLQYGTYLGTALDDIARGIAVDPTGVTSIAGMTESAVFPTTSGSFDETQPGNGDAFVAQFNLRCFRSPFATVSGDAIICIGDSTTIEAALSGFPPWDINWSDGFPQTGVLTSPATRLVSPGSNTIYTVISVSDTYCTGLSSGSASITVNSVPEQPDVMTGNSEVCAYDTGVIYTIADVSGATSYTWNVPVDASITLDQGTTSITVDFDITSGNISVTANNDCGSSSPRLKAITVHARPTAIVSGDASICPGENTSIEAALTGTGPWDVTWSDGLVQSAVSSSPATRIVSPGTNTVYSVTLLNDSNCSYTGTGSASITVLPTPSATVSGESIICLGDASSVQADLTGAPPWDVTWSDHTVYSNVMISPLVHHVSPLVSTLYSVTSITDTNCTGSASGEAVVKVRTFQLATDPKKAAAQGLVPLVFEAFPVCDTPPTELEWTIPSTSFSFGIDVNPIMLTPIPTQTTEYLVRGTDQTVRTTVYREVILFVAVDPIYLDFNEDGCNTVEDIWALCSDWQSEFPAFNDPNGDGRFNVLDYLYINTDDPYPCLP